MWKTLQTSKTELLSTSNEFQEAFQRQFLQINHTYLFGRPTFVSHAANREQSLSRPPSQTIWQRTSEVGLILNFSKAKFTRHFTKASNLLGGGNKSKFVYLLRRSSFYCRKCTNCIHELAYFKHTSLSVKQLPSLSRHPQTCQLWVL